MYFILRTLEVPQLLSALLGYSKEGSPWASPNPSRRRCHVDVNPTGTPEMRKGIYFFIEEALRLRSSSRFNLCSWTRPASSLA